MSITEGATILKADLDALLSTALAALAADNARKPLGHHVVLNFEGVVTGVANVYPKAVFVVPFDCYVETLAVVCKDMVGTVTVAVTGDGAVDNFPITITGTAGAGVTKFARLLYDGTKTPLVNFATASRAFRCFPKGSTITVTVTTTNAAAASALQVSLVLRSFFSRGA